MSKHRDKITASPAAKSAVGKVIAKVAKEGWASVSGLSPKKARRGVPSMPRISMENNRPTAERIAKIAEGIEQASGTRAFRIRASMSAAEERLTQDEISVARQFVAEYLKAEAGALQRITAANDGMPIATKGPRHGGVSDDARPAFTSIALAYATMDHRFWQILEKIAVGVRREIDGKGWTLEEVGKQFLPKAYASPEQNRAVAVGLLKAALWRVGEHYLRQRALTRRTDP